VDQHLNVSRKTIAKYFAEAGRRPPDPVDVGDNDRARFEAAVVRFVMGVGK
jgi:hypothetical protein